MNWDTASKILGIVAGIGYILAFYLYNRSVSKGKTEPVATTWLIWGGISLVSAPSYFQTSGDIWASIIPLLNVAFCIGTFILNVKRGFNKVSRSDIWVIGIGVIATICWKVLGSASYANLFVQLAILTGFVPLWRSIWKGNLTEHPLPWWTWTAAYAVSIVVVIIRHPPDWIAYTYSVNCTWLHASVPLIAILSRKQLEQRSTR